MMNPTEELGPDQEPPMLDLVLRENEEEIEAVTLQEPDDTNNGVEAVKPAEKEPVKPAEKEATPKPKKTKKNNVAKAKGKSVSMKKKKVMRNLGLNQAQMFKDLSIFAGSLINELKVARENMFAQMKKELMACGARETTAVWAEKNKTPLQNGTESNVNCQNHSEVSMDKPMKSLIESDVLKNSKAVELAVKPVQATEFPMTNKQSRGRLPLNGPTDQLFQYSSSLPAVVPNPQGIHLDGGGPVVAPMDKSDGALNIKRRDPWNYYHGIPVSQGCWVPTPTHQRQDIGSSIMGRSAISTQTYSDAAFQNHSRLGLPMSARLPGVGALSSEDVLRSCMTSNVLQRNGGGSARPQSLVMKDNGQCYTNFRNKQ